LTDNDLKVTLFYEYDGSIIDSREPKETYQDGKHILSAWYVLNVDNSRVHTWKVWLKCEGGSLTIPIFQAQNAILGLNIYGNTGWDGTIDIRETIETVILKRMLINAMSDSATAEVQIPIDNPISQTIDVINVNGIELVTVSDHVGINEVVTNAWVDETTAEDMTYDDRYVIISNHNFILKTEFRTASTSVTIDDGYCTKVTPFITGLATIESVTVNEQVSN
jgi:hypothetical protein